MPHVPAHTLDVTGLARLDQVLLGLLPASSLPGADGDDLLDEEGTPIARRENGGVVGLRALRWPRPEDVHVAAPVVLALAETLPAAPLPSGAVLLLPSAVVRNDDARHQAWAAAWRSAAAETVELPLTPSGKVQKFKLREDFLGAAPAAAETK